MSLKERRPIYPRWISPLSEVKMSWVMSLLEGASFSMRGILTLWRQSFLNVVDNVVRQINNLT